jgi:hypothetical protein
MESYYSRNKEKIKNYQKEYYKNNKDKIKEYQNKNKEVIKEKQKIYIEKNKEIINKKLNEYYVKNKDKVNEKYVKNKAKGTSNHKQASSTSNSRSNNKKLKDQAIKTENIKIESKNNKQNCGNGVFADLAIFSFHPVKHIACGEGGMITTNDEALYNRLLKLRTHGITKNPALMHENHGGWYMEMQELGYNYRIPDMLCALGISQLERANDGLEKRKQIAKIYDEAFASNTNIITPKYDAGHAFHLYVIQVNNRLGLYNFLKENKIYAQVHYIPVHTMPYYKSLGFKQGDFPIAEAYYSKCLSLPMYPTLTKEEQQYVIDCINSFLKN